MTIAKKSQKLVDQIYDRDRGWIAIPPVPLRRLWWSDKLNVMRHIEAVHFVNHGDYKISELTEKGVIK